MKRPMGVVGLALTLTTWAAFFFDARQAVLLSLTCLVTGAVIFGVFRSCSWSKLAGLCCLTAAVGFALHTHMEQTQIQPFYDADGEVVQAEGMITQVYLNTRSVRYTIDASFPQRPDLPDTTITVRTYGEMEYLKGEVIRFSVELQPKTQPDAGLRLAPEDFLAGELQDDPELVEDGYAIHRRIAAMRAWLCENVYNRLDSESADIVTAMVLGQDDNVSTEAYSAVSRAGTIHLLSVSGLHLSILTAFVMGALAQLRLPYRLRSLLAILVAAAFTVLVGFSAPVIRSFAMTAMTLLASMLRKERDSVNALGVAVAIICVIWPSWLLGWGFWLSAGSTLGILLFGQWIYAQLYQALGIGGRLYNRLIKAVMGGVAISIAAYVTTFPFLTIFYGWISVISPLANILVAPFVPVVMAGGLLCALTDSEEWVVQLAAVMTDYSTKAILRISEIIGSVPFAIISIDEVWTFVWIIFTMLVLLLVWRFREDSRFAACGFMVIVLVFGVGDVVHAATHRDRIELVTIADCDAAVLLRDSEAVILGTPDAYGVGWLLRYLEYRGVDVIRAVIAADCGEQIGSGLFRLADQYPIDCIIGPNDTYILDQLANALPEIPVYSGGYAQMDVLGGLPVTLSLPEGDILLHTPRGLVRKTVTAHTQAAIDPACAMMIYPDEVLLLQGISGSVPAPLGEMLYGEKRFWLN